MAHSFIAYIDEAGDEGLNGPFRRAGRGGGSSHWLTIGCTIWRYSRDLDAVRWAQSIIAQLPVQKRNKPLHYMELNHAQRVMAVKGICERPMRIISVIANKHALDPAVFNGSNLLYHFLCRYLLERISWLCRDMRPQVPEGDGRVKIVFSRKRSMNYDNFQAYLDHLRGEDDPEIKIHWPVIDIPGIEAADHGSKFGLQIADLAVSGITAALEPDFYGNVETRFARDLKPRVYHRGGNFMSYGAKMVPLVTPLQMTNQQSEFVEIFKEVR